MPPISTAPTTAVITYGNFSFGNPDSSISVGSLKDLSTILPSTPPEYKLRGTFEYDQSGRTVIGTKYTLMVHTIIYAPDEVTMSAQISDIRKILSTPRQQLQIKGFGTGFNAIVFDEQWGPKPLDIQLTPIGFASFELFWTVQFFIKDCDNAEKRRISNTKYGIAAFNFDTTWSNDYEGITTRQISGTVQIANPITKVNKGPGGSADAPTKTADAFRDIFTVICPFGFKRVQNTWTENNTKNQLSFVIVDQMLKGTPYPPGCTDIQASLSYAAGGRVFNRAMVTLTMTIKTEPYSDPSLAWRIFSSIALSKQVAMTSVGDADSKAIAVAESLQLVNHKYDNCRVSHCSITWLIAQKLGTVLDSIKLWEPLPAAVNPSATTPGSSTVERTYNLWRKSIEPLWNNRGIARIGAGTGKATAGALRSDPNEGIVIDLCNDVSSVTIGNTPAGSEGLPGSPPTMSFVSPTIPEDGGWLVFDLVLSAHRIDEQTAHAPSLTDTQSSKPRAVNVEVPKLDGAKDKTPSTTLPGAKVSGKTTTEFHGVPRTHITVKFKGMKVGATPKMPILKSVDGKTVEQKETKIVSVGEVPGAFVPVRYLSAYTIYEVKGVIQDINSPKSKLNFENEFVYDTVDY